MLLLLNYVKTKLLSLEAFGEVVVTDNSNVLIMEFTLATDFNGS
jgi:hypothetical protein